MKRRRGLIPLQYRPRFSYGWHLTANVATVIAERVPVSEILPGDFPARFWCVAELRGCRNSTSVAVVLLNEVRDGCGRPLFKQGGSGVGLVLSDREGPIPLWVPTGGPAWDGFLDLDYTSDIAAVEGFELMITLVELDEREWRSMRDNGGLVGSCGDVDDDDTEDEPKGD